MTVSDVDTKLEVEGLKQHFPVNTGLLSRLLRRDDRKMVRAVDGVSLVIKKGESFGIAGESGCGKTTLGKTAIRLLEPTAGRITFDGEDITDISGDELTAFRREAQIIHQDPYQSLNPRFTVYKWVKEPLDIHGIGSREDRNARVFETLEEAGLTPPEAYVNEYTSDLSGGERQRVGIARALALEPSFILADEPASMLDVSIRADVLDTFNRLKRDYGLTQLFISHDLSLLKHMCDRIAIMYLGEIVEVGPAEELINDPKHPYTQALVSSVSIIDPDTTRERVELIGQVPDPVDVPSGCRFNPRCPKIVQPHEFDLEQAEWRSVANLRSAVLDAGSAAEVFDTFREDPREAFGIPEVLSDATAESALEESILALRADDIEAARQAVINRFASPCLEPVDTYQLSDARTVQCVRYEADAENA